MDEGYEAHMRKLHDRNPWLLDAYREWWEILAEAGVPDVGAPRELPDGGGERG